MPLHIAFDDLTYLLQRCEVTTVRATREEPEYEKGSVVPSGPWMPITEADGLSLAAPACTPAATLVEIVRPPAPRTGALEHLATPLGDENTQYLGQSLARPNMMTTTQNYQDGKLIGLHVDNWDKLSHGQKPHGRRRLALNLGPGARYLIVGALDAQAVGRAVHPDDFALRHPSTDDYREHVAAGHPVSVYRIRLAPGEGYMAPTEYLLHDGSTEGEDRPSAAAFWPGRWTSKILPSLI
ncbi:hypothetical protein [Streptomyces sp. NPDC008125]|uniref:hypothetical protein n=1 Tax=Streptomyces sp. NPDC008125 TaxID=3364811 RepID=UPI0036E9754D